MIYTFQRVDGSGEWADYSEKVARREGKHVKALPAETRAELESLIKSPGPVASERVQALAERALKELVERTKPKVRDIEAPTALRIGERDFWGRLRWLLTGK